MIEFIEQYEQYMIRLAIACLLVCACFSGCNYVNAKLGLKSDNVAEELFEDLIESKTGWHIDLTPDSPE